MLFPLWQSGTPEAGTCTPCRASWPLWRGLAPLPAGTPVPRRTAPDARKTHDRGADFVDAVIVSPGRTAKAAFRSVCQPADPQPAKETRAADPQAVSGARRLQPAGVCAG